MRFRLLLILSSLLLLSVNSRAEEDKYIFEHIQTSHHWINDIFQDSDGFIWVSCRNGLYRHYGDGPDDYETIQDGNIFYDITQDADGNIWVMSREGLVMCDPKTAVMHDPVATTDYLRAESWIDCFEVDGMNNFWWNDESGRIWIGTLSGGVQVIDPVTYRIKTFTSATSGLSNDAVLDIEYSDCIVLSHDMSIFSIAFSNLDYFSVHDMPLYYRMEGLSQEWLPTDSHAGKAEEYCSE